MAVSAAMSPALRAWYEAYRYVRRQACSEHMVTTNTGHGPVPYPVAPAVGVLHAADERYVRSRVLGVYSALRKIVLSYPNDRSLQDFLALPRQLAIWVDCDRPRSSHVIDLCRFDMVGSDIPGLRVLEFNSNCPGGALYSGMLMRSWREAPQVSTEIASWPTSTSGIEDPHWFADWLLGFATDEAGDCADPHVVLLRPDHGNQLEIERMRMSLAARGSYVAEQDVASYRWDGRVRVGYLKHSVPAYQDMTDWSSFCAAVTDGKLAVPSGLAARWIADNKLCVAVMSDPRFDYLFDSGQREAIASLVPHSRKLGDGISLAEVVERRCELVVKRAYGTQGRAVFVGSDYNGDGWRKIVHDLDGAEWLVQEYVRPETIDVSGQRYFRDLSSFVFDGTVQGYCSRMGMNSRLNIAQGGARQVVFVLNDQ